MSFDLLDLTEFSDYFCGTVSYFSLCEIIPDCDDGRIILVFKWFPNPWLQCFVGIIAHGK